MININCSSAALQKGVVRTPAPGALTGIGTSCRGRLRTLTPVPRCFMKLCTAGPKVSTHTCCDEGSTNHTVGSIMWQRVGDWWYAVVVLLAGPASLLVEKTPQLSRMHSATCNPSTPSGPWLWGEKTRGDISVQVSEYQTPGVKNPQSVPSKRQTPTKGRMASKPRVFSKLWALTWKRVSRARPHFFGVCRCRPTPGLQ